MFSAENSFASWADEYSYVRERTWESTFEREPVGVVDRLSPEKIAIFREAFSLYDRDGEGLIQTRELRTIMQSLGYYPTDAELADMLNEVDSEGFGVMNYPDFQMLMAKMIKTLDTVEELIQAFQAFDRRKTGYVLANDIRLALSQVGDKLSAEDIEDMIKDADVNGDQKINYTDFVSNMAHR